MSESVDILIAGAGPAGGRCAYEIMRIAPELSVVLVERQREIARVCCGEGVPHSFFADIGLDEPTARQRDFLNLKEVSRPFVQFASGYKLQPPEEHWSGYALDRERLDRFMATLAVDAGARLLVGASITGARYEGEPSTRQVVCEVKGPSYDGEMRARLVIDATGVGAKVASALGVRSESPSLLRAVGCTIQLGPKAPSANSEFVFKAEWPRGYLWAFTKNDRQLNVGVGFEEHASTPDPQDAMDGYLLERFGQDFSVFGQRSGALPGSGPFDSLVADNLIRVGDAGGFVEPLLYEGIRPGAMSGISAGRVAVEALKSGDVSETGLKGFEQGPLGWPALPIDRGTDTLGGYMAKSIQGRAAFYDVVSDPGASEQSIHALPVWG